MGGSVGSDLGDPQHQRDQVQHGQGGTARGHGSGQQPKAGHAHQVGGQHHPATVHAVDQGAHRRGEQQPGWGSTNVTAAIRPGDPIGDSLDLLLGELAALGLCQPDGTFVATLQDLRERLAEMTEVGEAVCVDGLATRVQRPGGWANQKVLYEARRRTHTAQGVALSTIHGDLLWCDGGCPGSCHEHELLEVSGVRAALDATGVTALVDRGFRPNATTTTSRPCCAGSGTSTGPPRRSSASADGSTASRHEGSIRTPSLTNWSTML